MSKKFNAQLGILEDIGLSDTGDTATGDYDFDTDTLKIDSTNHRIGIGTTAPPSKLFVLGGGSLSTFADSLGQDATIMGADIPMIDATNRANFLILSNSNLGIDVGGSVALGGRYSGTASAQWAKIKGAKETATSGEYGGYLAFGTHINGNGMTEKMRIKSNGNVGIGTAAPGQKLSVNGDVGVIGSSTVTSLIRLLKPDVGGEFDLAYKVEGGLHKVGIDAGGWIFNFAYGGGNTHTYTFPGTGGITLGSKITTYNNIVTEDYGVPAIVDGVHLAAKTADISATNISNAGVAGSYEVSYYLQATTADAAAGTITLTFAWTDDAGATTKTDTLALTALGRTYGSFPARLASGNLTYAVAIAGSYGNSQYRLDVTTKRVN